jgi:hypothetical protein
MMQRSKGTAANPKHGAFARPAKEETPRIPAGFRTEVDKEDWRH